MKRSTTCRIYPDTHQERQLNTWFSEAARLHNLALCHRQTMWTDHRKSINDQRMMAWLQGQSHDLPNAVARDVVLRVQRSLDTFAMARGRKEYWPYPKFHERDRQGYSISMKTGFAVNERSIEIEGLGALPVRPSQIVEGDKPLKLTLSRSADGFFASITYDVKRQQLPRKPNSVGIDIGLSALATLSDGTRYEPTKSHRKTFARLKKLVASLSRCQPGSNQQRERCKEIERLRARLRNQQRDLFHRTAREIVDNYQTIAIERLEIRPMTRQTNGLEWSTANANWGTFTAILKNKAREAGRIVIEVRPEYTSQRCSRCGVIEKKTIDQRWHACASCGLELDRDHNAAKNILHRALTP